MNHSWAKEWSLWIVAVSCALHAAEEYFTGWQKWAVEALGIVMPTTRFVVANVVLVVAAFLIAHIGWKKPTLSLVIPAATLVNGVGFHILPTLLQNRVSPGVYTAAFLYVPFSSLAFLAARRNDVNTRAMVIAFVGGTLMMLSVVLYARSLSNLG
jgi:hypothetical protein